MCFTKRVSYLLAFACLIFLLPPTSLSAQGFEWVKTVSGNAPQAGLTDIVTDDQGYSYLSGTFTGSFSIGQLTFNGQQNQRNAFLAKVDPIGKPLWVKTVPSLSNGGVGGSLLLLARNGKLYWTGNFERGAIFNTDTLRPNGTTTTHRPFLARFDTSGQYEWAQKVGSSDIGSVEITDLQENSDGDIVLTGSFRDSLLFQDGTTLGTLYQTDFFLAKLSPAGNVNWVQQFGSDSFIGSFPIISLGQDGAGASYVCGVLDDSLTIGNQFYHNGGPFLARFKQDGSFDWIQIHDQPVGYYFSDVVTDRWGNSYFWSELRQQRQFGSVSLTAIGSSDALLCKYDSSGSLLWYKQIFGSALDGARNIALTGDSLLTIDGYFQDSLILGNQVLTNGLSSYLDYFVAQCDTAGTVKWANVIPDALPFLNFPIRLHTDQTGNVYFIGQNLLTQHLKIGTLTDSIPPQLYFFGKISTQWNTVHLSVFRDDNSNGLWDPGESGMPNMLMHLQQNDFYTLTDANGFATGYSDSGLVVTSMPQVPVHYSAVPASDTLHFSDYFQSDSSQFALQPNGSVQDLSILTTSAVNARRARMYPVMVDYLNKGTVPMSGRVICVADSAFHYISSSITPDTIRGNTLIWNLSNLEPLQAGRIIPVYQVNTSMALGSRLDFDAQILPTSNDADPTDNQYSDTSIVLGPFDPNDKTVWPSVLSPGQAQNQDWLTYLIRFQNTGNDTAFLVFVRDTLDAMLDPSTIDMQAASHPYTFSMQGNRLEWRFPTILLPDSTTDEPNSHGFIRFRIRPRAGLVLGDSVPNRVGIYFDYNLPIQTNTAVTQVDTLILTAQSLQGEDFQLFLYPNPTQDVIHLRGDLPDRAPVQVALLDLNGRVMKVWNWALSGDGFDKAISLEGFASGLYLLRVTQGPLSGIRKIMLR